MENSDIMISDMTKQEDISEEMLETAYDKLQILESENKPFTRLERLRAMNTPLLAWYKLQARVLPWRENQEPYQVWISEIMLQQTRVEAVKPYFVRFMEAFPDVKALAKAQEEQLLKMWEGLGYYNRARNLQKAAKMIVEFYDGCLPASYEELLKLPGIGSYTAGAIASIAYGIAVPAVDGNVLRVISRILASKEDILKQSVKKQIEADLKETMPKDHASIFNQGLFEVGAMVCIPNGQPKCKECPLFSLCLGRKKGLLDLIPYRAPKKPRRIEEHTILILESGNQVAIEKRPDNGLLASLYQFPNLDGHLSQDEVLAFLKSYGALVKQIDPIEKAKHIFSHVEWHMNGYLVSLERTLPNMYLFVEQQEIRTKYPLPNAFSTYIKLINGES